MATRTHPDWLRIALIVLAVVVLLPLVTMTAMMPMMGAWGWQSGGMMGGGTPLWGLGMSFVWLVVLLGLGYLLYRGVAGGDTFESADPALEELRLAYARGDVTEDEYETRRERLRRE